MARTDRPESAVMTTALPSLRATDTGSLWSLVTPPGPALTPLAGVVHTDAVVIGGGFTGLSTALHLRQAGTAVVVLEAAEPGWGASGRNNGQVIPTLSRPDPDDIEARHGDAGARFVGLLRDCAQILFDTVRAHGIDAEAEQTGWVQPAHSPGRVKISERRVRQWAARGAPVELLDAQQTAAMLGSSAWFGGFWNRSGGHINPLALARGMARVVQGLGGVVHGDSPVRSFAQVDGRWRVRTAAGAEVHARALVLATNAYTAHFSPGLAPRVARQVVPVRSWQMATRPLTESERATLLPGRQAFSDTRGALFFGRLDARHRLVTGGAVLRPVGAAERLKIAVGERLRATWPQLAGITFDAVWHGPVGMTRDFLPRFHRLGPNAWAWAGCNGRAVGLSVAIGRELAKAVQGVAEQDLALPFTEPDPLPLHGLACTLAPLNLLRYRRMDQHEL